MKYKYILYPCSFASSMNVNFDACEHTVLQEKEKLDRSIAYRRESANVAQIYVVSSGLTFPNTGYYL